VVHLHMNFIINQEVHSFGMLMVVLLIEWYLVNNTGNLTCTGTITQNFSWEIKTKIGNIPYALDKINSLNGFTYYNNDLCKSFGFVGDEALVGVSAQEVQEVLPKQLNLHHLIH
jgi:hypothetical protein